MRNGLHCELAPITDAAWAEIEREADFTFRLHRAGRRVVDVSGPLGPDIVSAGTEDAGEIDPPAGVQARVRGVRPFVELRVPFSIDRRTVDDAESGAHETDWDPVKIAARTLAMTEDRTIFEGWPEVGITGLRHGTVNQHRNLPPDVVRYPEVISRALTELRLSGVAGGYALLLGVDVHARADESTDHGHPVRDHLVRILGEGKVIGAPAIRGGALVSCRGGDFELGLGQDLSIGYLGHDDDRIRLYLQETFTFSLYGPRAVVTLAI